VKLATSGEIKKTKYAEQKNAKRGTSDPKLTWLWENKVMAQLCSG